MCGKLDCYLQQFATLNVNINRNHWSAATCFKAPHKPFLLLSILDLIASGAISRNFIEPSFELAETFTTYWSRVMPLGTSGSMAYPFHYLDSSPFWHLVSRSEKSKGPSPFSSMKRLREVYLGAKFDDDLYPLLMMKSSREKLRTTLITTFFTPEVQSIVAEQGIVNCDSSLYSENLLTTADISSVYATVGDKSEEVAKRVRDQGFRKAIVKLYEHRCALCGIRMLTPEGHTIVEAAHIVPWSRSQDDKPQNGLALCRLCHWSFDEGLMGVGTEYDVLISPAVRQDSNFPGHMETLSGRTIIKPQNSGFWPEQRNLEIHRKEIFRTR